jgi:hypothetical protein
VSHERSCTFLGTEFQVLGIDAGEKVAVRKQLRRSQVIAIFKRFWHHAKRWGGTMLKTGQVLYDNDPRYRGRKVEVVRVEGSYAVCVCGPRQVKVRLDLAMASRGALGTPPLWEMTAWAVETKTRSDMPSSATAAKTNSPKAIRNRRLADGAIPDDQLALAAPERKHGIDDEQTCLNRLADKIAVDDRRGWTLHRLVAFGIDCSAVERAAQRIDGATEQSRSHGYAHELPGASDPVPRFDPLGLVEQNASQNVAVQSEGEADLTVLEANEFVQARAMIACSAAV